MRAALARHDIGRVYRLLGAAGVSQRRIASMTGQNQSEISEVVSGRQVQAYAVLARIADGLGVPRGYMGLAYSDTAARRWSVSPVPHGTKDDDLMERRGFLGLVSKIVMGASLTSSELDLLAVAPGHTPAPDRVGAAEVDQVKSLTAALRAYDVAHGGGSCRDAILAHTQWAESLLHACPDALRPRLLSAVAETKTLAGWTAHDLGLAGEARRYLGQAVRDTQEAGDPAHTAIVLHHLGRVPLDNGDPVEALKFFQLGQIAAQDSRSGLAVAFLLANEAVAYAHQNDARQAVTALRRAEDEFAHTRHRDEHPGFARFFDHAALQTAAARVHSQLGLSDEQHRAEAIIRLRRAVVDIPADHARQRAFNLAWLATCLIAEGEYAAGVELGRQAVEAVRDVASTRLREQLKLLQEQAQRHQHDSDVRQLGHDVAVLRSAA
ncbi:helix-turn-helix domain-containing protein [Streptoalloteichus hindustanus]|nr:helix-turn-helix domain-containing protein [Streptoalloteichus hindustanus]